ncbi:lysylphosphatidylglycerol synthase transmembrane domain-containing protein [Streptomyces sp. H10-C2]|uniref:lysylphosphatidylglycerol synthase transmembrane domain-containing protein n=1 Tax=unclassified Streptomyces TaxID=2593676 RepID=UPI0024B8C9C5|nr:MULTISPECIES: lysylphosphatidylglycerol synthase transmembrane domain-containing protein [unclassified Streptomyces]MDJ0343196.1 lysylphosphatidylglycerol synthase transmembrane domain-containing protein [Streptomyces sp. PH10-H1]MDJ0370671.1 lysylphosphatidylglycerol synthase transmembrane domain-containing protein [Streptomyces sp. H10-C2]
MPSPENEGPGADDGTGTDTAPDAGTESAQESPPDAGSQSENGKVPDGTGDDGTGDEATGTDPAEVVHSDDVSSDEPLLAARVHRPADLMRFLLGLLGIAVVMAIAGFAHATTNGVEQDIAKGARNAPDALSTFAGLTASIAVLIVPVAFAIERLIKRDGLRIADGVLAAVLAHGVALATDLWVTNAAPDPIKAALTQLAPSGGGITDPVHGYLAPVIAYMTAVGMARRPRWRVLLWFVLLLDAFAVLVGGYTTPFSIVVTVLIGWTVAYGTLYSVGSPNVRPTGQNLLAGLRRVGFAPLTTRRADDEGPETPDSERGRGYLVTLEDGPPLDVTVVDREQQAHGFFYRVWRRISLRGINQRRSLQSLRQALEQEALLAYAAIAAGANAPKLIATSELGPDAVMLVYEHIGGRRLNALPDADLTDELLFGAWQQVKALQSRRIAHRRLVGESLLVDRSGKVFLTDLRGGEIAAGDIVLRMDIAQLLTTVALRVGPARAVASAVAVLGPDAVANSLPLLQPIALSRTTRSELKQLNRARAQRERDGVLAASAADKADKADKEARVAAVESAPSRGAAKAEKKAEKRAIEVAQDEAREEDLLSRIRRQVLLIRPQAAVEPVRLERIKPRTLVTVIAGAIAAYFLLSQISSVPIADTIARADWRWAAIAVFGSALSYVAAACALAGFVPERLSLVRTVMAQIAGSFVKLVAPAAVGGVALNTRFLQKSGVRPGLAVASVGASQLVGLGSHILLLLTFGYITGTEKTPSLSPSRTVMAGLLTAGVLVLVGTAIPSLRKFVSTRVRALFAGVIPRMLDVLQRPAKLLTGIGGTLMVTVTFVICLDACVRSFGGSLSYSTIAVVFLAGNAIGSAAPTPGGVGAVEFALTGGLIAAGLPGTIATPAVLLFRLLTFWLPVLPGWLSFNYLSRKGDL